MAKKTISTKISVKEEILNVAEELIESKSYANVRVRNIADNIGENGISVGTLYHHFPNGKIDILLAIAEKYSDVLDINGFLADPNADLRAWLQKRLELDQKKRNFITAMEIEAMTHPNEIRELFDESIKLRKQNQEFAGVAYKMMEKFAGKKISDKKAFNMILVMKTMIRRHVVFGNVFGSNDEFIDLLLTIVQALVEDRPSGINVIENRDVEFEDQFIRKRDIKEMEYLEEEEIKEHIKVRIIDFSPENEDDEASRYMIKFQKDENWVKYEANELPEVEPEQARVLDELYKTIKKLNIKYKNYPLYPKLCIENKRVIGLSFYTRIFHWRPKSGEIVVDIVSKLRSLRTLILKGFENTGLKRLPMSVGNLKNLEYLDLSENTLTFIPESIGNLKKLRYLDLSDNLLELPASLGNLTSLRELYLIINKKILYPKEMMKLKSLQIYRSN